MTYKQRRQAKRETRRREQRIAEGRIHHNLQEIKEFFDYAMSDEVRRMMLTDVEFVLANLTVSKSRLTPGGIVPSWTESIIGDGNGSET